MNNHQQEKKKKCTSRRALESKHKRMIIIKKKKERAAEVPHLAMLLLVMISWRCMNFPIVLHISLFVCLFFYIDIYIYLWSPQYYIEIREMIKNL